MRLLVIGGTGFIGPHIISELIRFGHDVAVLHRGHSPVDSGAREIVGDRRQLAGSRDAIRSFAPDVVVDVVLSSGRQARELVDLVKGHVQRVVAVSSMDVYRACGVTHRLEEGPLEPLPLREDSSALRSKLQTYPPEQIQMLQQVFGWVDEHYDKIPVEREILGNRQVPGTIVRLPMVYGPGDALHRFQPIVKRIADGRQTILFSADMAGWRATKGYVEDVGAAVALAAVSDQAAGRIFNVGEPDTLTELEWARQIARACRWEGEFRVLPDDRVPPHLRAPGNTAQQWIADTTRIRTELGFRDRVSREEAIRRTVEWERANPPTGFTPHHFDYEAEDAAR
jgi:nucleoside-diphosphate-sugar epimerase